MVIKDSDGWRTPAQYAKIHRRTKGKKIGTPGVSKQFIRQLMAQEIERPNSTDIDVYEVDGVYFVRYKRGQ